jgi:hypothetical protein
MDLRVILDYAGGNAPKLPISGPFFDFTELESEFPADCGSTTALAVWFRSSVNHRDVYCIELHLSRFEWYWGRPVALHLYFGSVGPKLFVGTRRYDHERKLVWHQASPREAGSCSSCV